MPLDCGSCNGQSCPRMPLDVWMCNWSILQPKSKESKEDGNRLRAGARRRGIPRRREICKPFGGTNVNGDINVRPLYSTCYPHVLLPHTVGFPPLATAVRGQKCVVLRCRAGCHMACSSVTEGARRPIQMQSKIAYAKSCLNLFAGVRAHSQLSAEGHTTIRRRTDQYGSAPLLGQSDNPMDKVKTPWVKGHGGYLS